MTSGPAELPVRRFLVTWRDGRSPPGIHDIGCLTASSDYAFSYLPGTGTAPGFRPLPGFGDLGASYHSPSLFLLFAARLMDRRRPDYQRYVEALDLADDHDALDLLGRSEGVAKGDRLAVVEEPPVAADGSTCHVFVVRGLRFALPEPQWRGQVLAELERGTPLTVRSDVGNPVNPDALRLDGPGGQPVGWVPDALVPYVGAVTGGAAGELLVRRRNGPDQPPHLRLLAEVRGVLPDGMPSLPQLSVLRQFAAT
jgi:hypothetical protein